MKEKIDVICALYLAEHLSVQHHNERVNNSKVLKLQGKVIYIFIFQ